VRTSGAKGSGAELGYEKVSCPCVFFLNPNFSLCFFLYVKT